MTRFGIKGALAYDRAFRIKMVIDPTRRRDSLDWESYFFLLVPQAMNAKPQQYSNTGPIGNIIIKVIIVHQGRACRPFGGAVQAEVCLQDSVGR